MRKLGLLILFAAPAWAQTTAQLEWTGGHPDRGMNIAFGAFADQKPPKLIAPIGLKQGRYRSLALGPHHSVFLAATASGAPPQIWVDGQRDADLSNDYGRRLDKRPYTLSLRTVLPGDRAPSDIDVRFGWKAPDRWFWLPLVHRAGTVVLANRLRPIALIDGNGDFLFTDESADRVLLDTNGDGEFDLRPGSAEVLKLNAICALGYKLTVKRDGSGVRFDKAPAPSPRPTPWTPATEDERHYWGGAPDKSFSKHWAEYRRLRKSKRNEKYPDQWVQRPLAKIGQFRTKAAGKFLWDVATKDKLARVRMLAVEALGEPAYLSYAPQVTELARGKIDTNKMDGDSRGWSYKIEEAAILALHHMRAPDRLAVYLDLLKGSFRSSGVDTLYRCLALTRKPEARAALAKAFDEHLKAKRPSYLKLEGLYEAMRYFDEAPDSKWSLRMTDPRSDEKLAALALRDLWWSSPDEARSAAIRVLKRAPKEPLLRAEIARVLAIAGDQQAVHDALIPWLNTANATLEKHLPAVRDPGGIDSLIFVLDAAQRDVALHALGSIRSKQVADALIERLHKAPSPALLRALGNQRDPRAAGALMAAARSGAEELRIAALEALARLPALPDEASPFLAGILSDGTILERIFAMFASRAESIVPAILPNLKHADWRVRLTAVRTLARLRTKGSIPSLIDVVGNSDERWRVRSEATHALATITQQRKGVVPEAWRRWWDKHGSTFRVPPIKHDASDERRSVASFFGIPIDSDRVVFVIDVSGSMEAAARKGKTRRQLATAQLLAAAQSLPGKPRINVVLFSNKTTSWKKQLTKLDPKGLARFLKKRKSGGGTFLYDGIEAAFADREADTIVVLTDGEVTGGKITDENAIVDAVRALNRGGLVRLHAVAIGIESKLLRRLAEDSDGRYAER